MKKLLAGFVFVASVGSVHAVDWGVNVNEVPLMILGPTDLVVESLKASAWLTQPLFGAELKLQGDASWSATNLGKGWKPGEVSFDLTEVSLKGVTPLQEGALGVVEWDAGRRNITDLSGGWILGSRWDGASASLLKGPVTLAGEVGYSGLLSKKSSRISASPADAVDNANPKVLTAPQRVHTIVSGGINELFARQDVQTELLSNFDLRSGPGALNSYYFTGQMAGPLPLGLRQKTFLIGMLSSTSAAISTAVLTGTELSATIPFMGSRLVVNGALALGGDAAGFQSVSGKGLAEVVSVGSAHGASIGSDYSLKPFPKTTVGVKQTLLFRTSEDLVSLPGFKGDTTEAFLGTEAGLYASWNPTSETSFGLNGGIFLPQSGAFVPDTEATILLVVTATLKL